MLIASGHDEHQISQRSVSRNDVQITTVQLSGKVSKRRTQITNGLVKLSTTYGTQRIAIVFHFETQTVASSVVIGVSSGCSLPWLSPDVTPSG